MTPQWFDSFRQWREALDARLGRMEVLLKRLADGRPTKDHFTVAEFAKLVDRSEYTVREWARLGRLRGEKTHGGRGRRAEWRFTLAELARYQAEGLLPDQTPPLVPAPGLHAVCQRDAHVRADRPPGGPSPTPSG